MMGRENEDIIHSGFFEQGFSELGFLQQLKELYFLCEIAAHTLFFSTHILLEARILLVAWALSMTFNIDRVFSIRLFSVLPFDYLYRTMQQT